MIIGIHIGMGTCVIIAILHVEVIARATKAVMIVGIRIGMIISILSCIIVGMIMSIRVIKGMRKGILLDANTCTSIGMKGLAMHKHRHAQRPLIAQAPLGIHWQSKAVSSCSLQGAWQESQDHL